MKLAALVRHYIRRWRPKAKEELDWFRQQPSLDAAISVAALAINAKGKRYSHQYKIPRSAIPKALVRLLSARDKIKHCGDFDELHDMVGRVLADVRGIGKLYLYDTALRIGAKQKRLPERIYLHAGTRLGARALGIDSTKKSVSISECPRELLSLEPHEIEDFLCIYKARLRGVVREV
jgi:hypothetical protein